jgi:hypothetical protein
VDFAAARVALHWSAHSRGYKLSKEGVDLRFLLKGDVCVVVLARCVFLIFVLVVLRCGPSLPFYSSQGEGSGYICGKKMKEKNKKGGLGRGCLPLIRWEQFPL